MPTKKVQASLGCSFLYLTARSEELETSAGYPVFPGQSYENKSYTMHMVIFRRACHTCRRNRYVRSGKAKNPLCHSNGDFSAHCPMSPDIFFGHAKNLYLCVIAVTGHLKTQDFGATGHFSEFVGNEPLR